jgi:multiple sugar transport system permease protein
MKANLREGGVDNHTPSRNTPARNESQSSGQKDMSVQKKKSSVKGYIFLLPILLLILVFLVYPFIKVIHTSFFTTRFGFGRMDFSGFKNYVSLFKDEVFRIGIYNSLIWTVGCLILQLSIPLGLALLLNKKFRGGNIVRSVILIPWITPVAGVAMMTRWILEPQLGLANKILVGSGLSQHPVNFLGSMTNALPTLMAISSWQFIPFGTLLMLAALQTISSELYDAIKIDGANSWQIFRFLIFPLVGSMIGFVFFFGFVWNFNTFALIWMTTQGGPVNSTMTLPVLIYRRAFKSFNMGQAAAMATMVGFFLIAVGFLFFKYMWKRSER